MGSGGGPSCNSTLTKSSSHKPGHEETSINDDEFDTLWEEAVAEAARVEPLRPLLSLQEPIGKIGSSFLVDHVNTSREYRRPSPTRKSRIEYLSAVDELDAKWDRRARAASVPVNRDPIPLGRDVLVRNGAIGKSAVRRRSSVTDSYVPKMLSLTLSKTTQSDLGRSSFDQILSDEGENIVITQDLERRRSTITLSDDSEYADRQKRPNMEYYSSGSNINNINSFSNMQPEHPKYVKKITSDTLVSGFSTLKHPIHTSDRTGEGSGWGDIESALPVSFILPKNLQNGGAAKTAKPRKVEIQECQSEAAKYVLKRLSSVTDNTQQAPLFSLPIIHSISAFKETRDQLSGLVVCRDTNSEVVIRDITAASIFAMTPLRRGHEILSINDLRVKCPLRATKIIKSIEGEVNLLVSVGTRPPGARYVRAKILKHIPGDSIINTIFAKSSNNSIDELGIALELNCGLVRVARVDEGNFLGDRQLRVDDIILAVNGEIARNVDIVTTLFWQSYRRGGVVNILVYSMVDLRLGLVDQIIKSPWESRWDKDVNEAIVSWPTPLEDGDHVSFCFDFRGWKCIICTPIRCDEPIGSGFAKEMNLAMDELNRAFTLVTGSWKDAIDACTPNQSTASCTASC